MIYTLIKVENGALNHSSIIEIQAKDNNNLIEVLTTKGLCNKVQGINFEYITKLSHWQAAGYKIQDNLVLYPTWREPVHFNEDFYEILEVK